MPPAWQRREWSKGRWVCKRHGIQPRAVNWSNGSRRWRECCSEGCHVEQRRVEPDILENVVVNSVVEDAAAAAEHKFLRTEHVPSEANARSKVVRVFGPNVLIHLNGTGTSFHRGEAIVHGEKRVSIRRKRRKRTPPENIGIQSGPKVVGRAEVLPSSHDIERPLRQNFPVVLTVESVFVSAVTAVLNRKAARQWVEG